MKNKTISIILKIATIIFGIYFLSFCAKDPSATNFLPPSLSLEEPVIKMKSIVLRCNLNKKVENSSLSFSFDYGTDPDLTSSNSSSSSFRVVPAILHVYEEDEEDDENDENEEDSYFYAEITDFEVDKKYYFRASVKGNSGNSTIVSSIDDFSTKGVLFPVQIGNLTWDTANIEEGGTYVEDGNWYYTWTQAKSVCPTGWRLPTKTELENLLKLGSTWDAYTYNTPKGEKGRWVGPDHASATTNSADKAIFFPALGHRNPSSSYLSDLDVRGSYWTSSTIGNKAYYMNFSSGSELLESREKISALSVRCVKGSVTTNSPVVATAEVTNIRAISATFGGEVVSEGDATVTERGFVYSSANANPEIEGSSVTKTPSGSGDGSYFSNITSLTVSTKYYVRAYATNSVGTSYGEVKTFTTTAASTDAPTYVDGSYSGAGVRIGDLWWAPVNVKYGEDVPHGLLFNWGKDVGFKYNGTGQSLSDGNWAEGAQGPCPADWYVPSEAQYDNLLLAVNSPLGTDSNPGQWRAANGNTPNGVAGRWFGPDCKIATASAHGQAVFFPAAGSWRGSFTYRGSYGYYWSSTSGRRLYFNSGYARMYSNPVSYGFSVRCVKN